MAILLAGLTSIFYGAFDFAGGMATRRPRSSRLNAVPSVDRGRPRPPAMWLTVATGIREDRPGKAIYGLGAGHSPRWQELQHPVGSGQSSIWPKSQRMDGSASRRESGTSSR